MSGKIQEGSSQGDARGSGPGRRPSAESGRGYRRAAPAAKERSKWSPPRARRGPAHRAPVERVLDGFVVAAGKPRRAWSALG